LTLQKRKRKTIEKNGMQNYARQRKNKSYGLGLLYKRRRHKKQVKVVKYPQNIPKAGLHQVYFGWYLDHAFETGLHQLSDPNTGGNVHFPNKM
jgi:hypothetical protein